MSAAIQTLALSKRYGSRIALDRVTLAVRSGSLFGLLGPNGAGKSTLVKVLLGLARPTEGGARLLGRPHTEVAVRRRIGYLPELFRYPPWLSAQEVLTAHALLAGAASDDDRLEALLAQVGLEGQGAAKVAAFSKGMQKRLGWAVALVGRPDLLFLDEPTSALDPLGRHDLMELLRRLNQDGVTVLLNSHLLTDVQGLCDTVGLLHHGRLLRTGSVASVIRSSRSEFRLTTGELTPAVREALDPFDWEEVPPEHGGPGIRVAVDWALLPSVHRVLAANRIDVYLSEPVGQTLDAWFLDVVREDDR